MRNFYQALSLLFKMLCLPSCHLLPLGTWASSLLCPGLPCLPSPGVSPAAFWDICTCSNNTLLNCLLSAFSFNSALDVSLSWYPPFSPKGFAPNSLVCHEGADSHNAGYFSWVAFFLFYSGVHCKYTRSYWLLSSLLNVVQGPTQVKHQDFVDL